MLRSLRLALAPALVLALLLAGSASAIVRNGGPGNDRLDGTAERDILRGQQGNDRIFGLGGDDRLAGGTGNDKLKGGPGRDDIVGSGGNDRIDAGFDDVRDIVLGGLGDDVIYGSGHDDLDGGEGDDKIYATYPAGDMLIDCGFDEDVLILNEEPPASVEITDCETVKVVSAG